MASSQSPGSAKNGKMLKHAAAAVRYIAWRTFAYTSPKKKPKNTITQAAQALGVERTNLHKKIKQHGLSRAGRAVEPPPEE